MRVSGIKSLRQALSLPRTRIVGANEAMAQFVALLSLNQVQKTVIVLPSHRDVSLWAGFFSAHEATLSSQKIIPAILPFWSLWGADRFVNQSLTKRQRLHALSLLAAHDSRCVIVTTLQGLGQLTQARDCFNASTITLTEDQTIDQDDLINILENSGYRSSTVVDEEGLFAARGSILDVFPPNEMNPVRLEFIGETLQSIRKFEVEDQKSKAHLDSVCICPASESIISGSQKREIGQVLYDYLLSLQGISNSDRDGLMDAFLRDSKVQTLDIVSPLLRLNNVASLDYASKDTAFIFPKSIEACQQAYLEFLQELKNSYNRDLESKRITLDPIKHFADSKSLLTALDQQSKVINIGSVMSASHVTEVTIAPLQTFEGVSSTLSASARFDQWIRIIQTSVQLDGASVIIFATTPEHEDRISTLLEHRDIRSIKSSSAVMDLADGELERFRSVAITQGDLSTWIWLEEEKTLLLPEHQLFGVAPKKQRSSSGKLKNYLSSFKDLKVGDLVVHTLHGIARYRGMITMTAGGIKCDFLHLEYAGSDKIYLPVDKLNMLQRYSSGSDSESNQSLDKLGGGGWDKRRAKVKQAIKDMADKLLKIQAQRALSHIHIYSKPNDDYFQFESEFPYDETEDQLKALQEVHADLESNKAMDRLICGDVGFGKTEVALRTAFRVAQEGLQVLVLVPTTILCYQHYRTFSDRLTRHGLRVAQLNRFIPAKTAKLVLEDTAAGKIDVLVGTHKLLSQNLKVKRLGLLIVDEEQKFGVVHKERLKELRAGADILTLTATPIPRTMHMAMLGLRDISIIATPPHNRLSVKTFIAKFDETLIKDALTHEITRGGQVFFVHNRVEDIHEMSLFIKSLVPRANVRFAHGQMKEQDLENTIIDFLEHKFDILVCTTIIESGVDMPNVNTLIVNDSDRFGLAQLYQMRGRVGRASYQAYAYFLTKEPGRLSDDARRRLDVLSTHQELGAGFHIASHDLEIRGAGNLLGAEQSGHASDVGLEMYTDLLAEAIAEIRGQMPPKPKVDTEIKLPVTAMFSSDYIPGEGQRLQLYKNLFSVDQFSEIEDLEKEVLDRFGPLPAEASKLFNIARIKFILSQLGGQVLTMNPGANYFEVRFGSLSEAQIDKIIQEVRRSPTTYRLSPDYRLYIYWDPNKYEEPLSKASEVKILDSLWEMLKPIAIELNII